MPAPTVLLGAVAYDPKVVTIWEGFRAWLRGRGLDFDFVLYSHYERQVEDLVAGRIDAAWNSPLAWLRAERLAAGNGTAVRALTMRDTDQDLTSVVVVRAASPVRQIADLTGRVVAVGAIDSPQATLIPLGHLAAAGVTVDVRRFDVGVGLHGDHIGGERDAARALAAGEVDAACMIDANHLAFVQEGTLPPEGTRIVAQTARYDHCNMTVRAPESDGVRLFGTLLLGMSYADPQVRPLLDLEGLTAWREGRTSGYGALADAVDASGFYSPDGRVTATDYRP
ncbi:PhnD/SsuA/transferrin family substrate-binding protein [Micromonospora sp. D93]|uniref:phosphate/phosphite/phosphonate ABC transporter substrate-binding protein n=1 Tax=Micromonospora sp. D93 TaxID=2824886 RepID=UPI001B37A923|nr:PhnD/SsuA/transferrin family substrate-binding protein [Micromonospora sp. D93]MBQ1018706.1 PhnD/SsuA/transferrin family substrate-binding protein [Micromonospora sp. D93]